MTIEAIRKAFNPESVKAAIRKRHGLAEDAPVACKNLVMTVEPQDDYTFNARITTDTLDRDGEVMIPQGMDASEFDKTGAIFWNHNYDLPLGKPKGKLSRGDRYVDATVEFAKRPADYQGEFFPDFARAMVGQRIVKGVSIGFIPTEGRHPTEKDFERYGPDVKRVWNKWKLLEWSIAPVQCNPDAMIQNALAKGIITREQLPDDLKGMEVPDPAGAEPVPAPIRCPQCGGEMEPVEADAMQPGMMRCKACGHTMPMPSGKSQPAPGGEATPPAPAPEGTPESKSAAAETPLPTLPVIPKRVLLVVTPPTQPVAPRPDPAKAVEKQVRIFVLKAMGRLYE